MVILRNRFPILNAVDSWLRGSVYTARFVIYKGTVPENFTSWQQLTIGVEGEGVSGPHTNLAGVRFDDDNGGFVGGAFIVSLLPGALELGRSDVDQTSTILYTVMAKRNNFEDRPVAQVRVNVLESALI